MVNGISMTSLPNSLRQITAYLCDRQEAAAVPRKITTANNKLGSNYHTCISKTLVSFPLSQPLISNPLSCALLCLLRVYP